MTVEVETPQGLKTGFSVMEMSGGSSMLALNGRTVDLGFICEAVPVDLPGGQTLFMLITGHGGSNIMSQVIRGFDPSYPQSEKLVALIAELARPSSIGRVGIVTPAKYNEYPTMVRFRDLNDPKTVERVDPNDLAKSFGPGVKLNRVFMTVTDEPVTKTIGKRLTWLGPYAEPSLESHNGVLHVQDASLPQLLKHGDFRRGTSK